MHTAISLPYRGVSLIEIPRRETPRQRPPWTETPSWTETTLTEPPPLDRDAPEQRPPGHARFGQHYHKGFFTCLSFGDNDTSIPLTPKLCNSVQEGLWHCTFTVLPIQLLGWFNWLTTLSMSLVMGKTSKMVDPSVKNNLSGSTPVTIETNLPIQSGQIILFGEDEPPLTQHS